MDLPTMIKWLRGYYQEHYRSMNAGKRDAFQRVIHELEERLESEQPATIEYDHTEFAMSLGSHGSLKYCN